MKLVKLQQKLIAAARADSPRDQVPFAFEKRVMALLASRAALQNLDCWVRGLWRAAASCVAVAMLCGVWSLFTPSTSSATSAQGTAGSTDLSQDFENTLLAAVNQSDQTP
jgi:negative regulator of sigma E activity